MAFVSTPDGPVYYRLEGADHKPVLVLAHSLGLDHGMWDAQVVDLVPHFRVLRCDLRGHGASMVPNGDYTIEQLGREVIALTEALGIRQFAFCGLSIGGMVGQWLGVHAADRLTHLMLANATARVADPDGGAPRGGARRRYARSRRDGHGAILLAGVAGAESTGGGCGASHGALDAGGWLRRLLHRRPRHGSARRPRPHRHPDAGHRRRPRRLDAVGVERRAAGLVNPGRDGGTAARRASVEP